jgi:hypothetical protein
MNIESTFKRNVNQQNINSKRAQTARKILPPNYLEKPIEHLKTLQEMNDSQQAWNKRLTRDREYWHMKKQSYNGNSLTIFSQKEKF